MDEKPRIYHFECRICFERDVVGGQVLADAEGWIACDICGRPMTLVDPLENAYPGEQRVVKLLEALRKEVLND